MTERLYYWDAYTTAFTAVIRDITTAHQRQGVILDRTYFYPTSGGQPHDTGTLNGQPVVDVSIREADGAIVHWVAGEVQGEKVTAVIYQPRRFDHMQQHTGQHILSQAFRRIVEAETVGFHLGEDNMTIDLARPDLTPTHRQQVENLANQVIWENRPITARLVSLAEAKTLPLRKIPTAQSGELRLIEIDRFDLTACGGTHVAHTGEVGLLKIVKVERHRGQVRVEFHCGQRAVRDYEHKHQIVTELIDLLTTGAPEIIPAVQRLQLELKESSRQLKQREAELLTLEVEHLRQAAQPIGNFRLVMQVWNGREPAALRALAAALTAEPGMIVLLGLAGSKSHLLFARSADVPLAMNQLIQPALQQLGGRGGGTAVLAQGGGPAATTTHITQILLHIATTLPPHP